MTDRYQKGAQDFQSCGQCLVSIWESGYNAYHLDVKRKNKKETLLPNPENFKKGHEI